MPVGHDPLIGTPDFGLSLRGADTMVSSCASRIAAVPLERVVGRTKLVPPDSDTVRSARAAGIEFGG